MSAAGHLRQVIIAGKPNKPDTQALLNATFSSFTPDKVLICASCIMAMLPVQHDI